MSQKLSDILKAVQKCRGEVVILVEKGEVKAIYDKASSFTTK